MKRRGLARWSSSTKLHIRITWLSIHRAATKLPPTEVEAIPDCQGKTPEAQMHLASELHLSTGPDSINALKLTVQANSG
jgi:hypothetical protein